MEAEMKKTEEKAKVNWRNLPRIPKEKVRDKYIKILVNTDEVEMIDKLALKAGYSSVSKYVRDQAIAGKLHVPDPQNKFPLKKVAHIKYELRRIGVNVNQMTKKLHERGAFDRYDRMALRKIRDAFKELEEQAMKLHYELSDIKLELANNKSIIEETEIEEEFTEEIPFFQQPGFNIVDYITGKGKK